MQRESRKRFSFFIGENPPKETPPPEETPETLEKPTLQQERPSTSVITPPSATITVPATTVVPASTTTTVPARTTYQASPAVENQTFLPQTGDRTTVLMLTGFALLLSAGWLLFVRKRRMN